MKSDGQPINLNTFIRDRFLVGDSIHLAPGANGEILLDGKPAEAKKEGNCYWPFESPNEIFKNDRGREFYVEGNKIGTRHPVTGESLFYTNTKGLIRVEQMVYEGGFYYDFIGGEILKYYGNLCDAIVWLVRGGMTFTITRVNDFSCTLTYTFEQEGLCRQPETITKTSYLHHGALLHRGIHFREKGEPISSKEIGLKRFVEMVFGDFLVEIKGQADCLICKLSNKEVKLSKGKNYLLNKGLLYEEVDV